MKRRTFIVLSGVAISTAGASLVNFYEQRFADKNLYAKPELLSQLCDDDALRGLGRAFLKLNPTEASRGILERKLYGAPVEIASLSDQDVSRMRGELKKSTTKDFETGATIILKGWVLSLTEARQCALYFILNS